MRDPDAQKRNWTKFLTPEAIEDVLSFNAERVIVGGVSYPKYFSGLGQYTGKAGLIHCVNADNNLYKKPLMLELEGNDAPNHLPPPRRLVRRESILIIITLIIL